VPPEGRVDGKSFRDAAGASRNFSLPPFPGIATHARSHFEPSRRRNSSSASAQAISSNPGEGEADRSIADTDPANNHDAERRRRGDRTGRRRMSDLWVAAVMGIVEGVTEFLPISSTGHLIVAGDLLHFTGEKASSFSVFIQLGAIMAVVVLYRHRFVGLIPGIGEGFGKRGGFLGWRGLTLLALTTIPALIAGFFAHHAIKEYLFSPVTVAWALAVGGVGIILAEKFKPDPKTVDLDGLTYGAALMIGLFQCLALWPGMSRSASTIIGGLFSGLDRRTAAEYSFLAAVPVMVAATAYDLLKTWRFLEFSDLAFFATGLVVSFLCAALAVKTFIAAVQRWSLVPYAWYRLAIAPLIYFLLR
jgi:undecaprenyl-diphosphatase